MRRLCANIFVLGLILAGAGRAWGAVDIVNGPMLGHVTDSSARVWLQLSTSASVTIKVYNQRNNEVAAINADVEGPSPFILDTPVGGLDPNTLYRLDIYIDDKKVEFPQDFSVTTAPSPGEVATFSVDFGSGLNPKNDATGLFKAVKLTHPREFLFLGDVGYLPEKEGDFPAKHRDAFKVISDFHKATRATPEIQNLLFTTPTLATWNDRDFGPAGSGMDFIHAKESLIAFTRYWPNPDYGVPETPGVFCSFTLADADFFLLDNRLNRTGAGAATGPAAASQPGAATQGAASQPGAAALYGEGQLAWLKDKLKKSTARFKVIASGDPLLQGKSAVGSWGDYAQERAGFLKWLDESKIGGVVFISGGAGFGELTTLGDGPGHAWFDLTSSSLSGEAAGAMPQVDGKTLAVFGEHNFGELEFGGPRTKRFVTLRLHDAAGKTKIEKTVFADGG